MSVGQIVDGLPDWGTLAKRSATGQDWLARFVARFWERSGRGDWIYCNLSDEIFHSNSKAIFPNRVQNQKGGSAYT